MAPTYFHLSLAKKGTPMFFGESRKALLEFLRNLTPQIIFLTLSLILGSKLDLTEFQLDRAGIWNALPFSMCLFVFLGASLANMSMFIDASITSNEKLDDEVKIIRSKNLKSYRLTFHLLCAAWKFNKPAFFQLCITLIVIEIAFVAVFIIAIQGALVSPLLHR